MTEDPFVPPAAAFARPAGHVLPQARAKLAHLIQPLASTGVPLGGIGTGGIMRGSDGRFSRWTIKAGGLRQFSLPANGFIQWVKPAGGAGRAVALQPAPETAELSAFAFEAARPAWHGLFPKAWHRHAPLGGVIAECLSFSPVCPGAPAEAALPLAVFRWRLTNFGKATAETSLCFTFANMNGWFGDFDEGRPSRPAAGAFNRDLAPDRGAGVILDRRRAGAELAEGSGEWAIAVEGGEGAVCARTLCFDGSGDGGDFWDALLRQGDAPDLGAAWVVESGFRETAPALPAAAVSGRVVLAPGEARELTFTLIWDLPAIGFGQGRRWYRAYTDAWGREGRAAAALTAHAQANADVWCRRIGAWHDAEMAVLGPEPHRAGAVINEAFFLVDGLTVWTSAHDAPDGRARFGLIECPEYALYDTLDLWVYAAEAVARFLPEAAAEVAAEFARQLLARDPERRRHRWDGTLFEINAEGACPHDLGGPLADPFVTPNDYTYRDSTRWKDLNADLVICLWREGQAMGPAWRVAQFDAVRSAMAHLERFDRDGDGLIENDGSPDQTFDNIPMRGPSSYCGGLWIAALLAAARMAGEAGATELARDWADRARGAAAVFDRLLYNGRFYRVDTDGPLSEACFIEQLFGPFLARRLGLGDIVPPDRARSALRAVYEANFLRAGRGEGAVTLADLPRDAARALPHQDDTSFQTAEIQPGFNYSFAAQLECWDLHDEADRLRRVAAPRALRDPQPRLPDPSRLRPRREHLPGDPEHATARRLVDAAARAVGALSLCRLEIRYFCII